MIEIPLLSASDVELRVGQLQQTNHGVYVQLLCYKDARCDMRMLDLIFGPMNWKRSHELINGNLFCTISIWDPDKAQWITKQDVGTESATEAEKGQASDSFKRAATNVGIGRELYNSPNIRFKLNDDEVYTGSNGKPKTYAKFYIRSMRYDKETCMFTEFTVVDKDSNVRFDINGRTAKINTVAPVVRPETKDQGKPAEQAPISPPWENNNSALCTECGTVIKSPKVLEFANKRFGRALCYNCQKRLG